MAELQLINRLNGWLVFGAKTAIRCYQLFIGPLLGPACRFTPSCSHYAMQAIERHGLFKGLYLAVQRLLRCHPWNHGGYDPVP